MCFGRQGNVNKRSNEGIGHSARNAISDNHFELRETNRDTGETIAIPLARPVCTAGAIVAALVNPICVRRCRVQRSFSIRRWCSYILDYCTVLETTQENDLILIHLNLTLNQRKIHFDLL